MFFSDLEKQGGGYNSAPEAPSALLTNELENPMNVEGIPRFSWWLNDTDMDESQTAYQIVVKDEVTGEQVFDSGKVNSSEQSNVQPEGLAEKLEAGHPYSWQVASWDSSGAQSVFSEPAKFATGLSDEDWGAQWIQAPASSPISVVDGGSSARVDGGGVTANKEAFEWENYELEVAVSAETEAAGIAFRVQEDYNNGYVWQIKPGIGLVKNVLKDGTLQALETVNIEIEEGINYILHIKADGNTIVTNIDGQTVGQDITDDNFTKGSFGFYEADGQVGEFAQVSATSGVETETWATVKGSTAHPITFYNPGIEWTNYKIEFDMKIIETAAGIMLRTPDANSGYMWQFSLDKGGLARHIQNEGKFTKIDGDSAVPYSLEADTLYHVEFIIEDNKITTKIDGKELDTYTDTSNTWKQGTFGFRETKGESASFSNLKVTSLDGEQVLLSEDFSDLSAYKNGKDSISVQKNEVASGETYRTDFSEGLDVWSNLSSDLPITIVKDGKWAQADTSGISLLNQGQDWTDYTLSMRVKVIKGAAGFVFRAPDSNNSGYMWQIKENGGLKIHKGSNGKFTTLKDEIPYGFEAGRSYNLRIEIQGNEIKTYVNGTLLDTTKDDTHGKGTIGFRESTTTTEIGQFTDIVVRSPKGEVLYEDNFIGGAQNWGVSDGEAKTGKNFFWYTRKEENLENKEIKSAIAYVAGSQDYELSVNGIRIGRGQTFDYLGETRYQGWDITEAVKGQKTLTLGILDRFYSGGQGRVDTMQGVLGHFVIYYADGSSQTVVTDGTWTAIDGPYFGNTTRNSEGDYVEECDGRKVLEGWAQAGYDASEWGAVHVHGTHPTKTFTHVQAELSHVTEEEIYPVSITKLEDGTTVADFGKVIPARLSIHFANGKEGQKYTIQTGYELTDSGAINTNKESTQSTNMTFIYTQKDGEQTYNTWDHLGFRYVSIPAKEEEFSKEDIKAFILYTEVPAGRDSTFESSNDMLNQVYELMKRSAIYSVQNQFVDTPTREKGQFLQDTVNISAVTNSIWYEREATRKAIYQFMDSADRYWDDGRYNSVYPNVDKNRDIPDFTLNFPVMVWRYYMQTGDKELLKQAYPYLQKTAEYIEKNTKTSGDTNGLVTALEGGGDSKRNPYYQGIVDWPKAGRFDYDWDGTVDGARTTVNALSVRAYDVLSNTAEELGKDESEIQSYKEKADNLKRAINNSLLTEENVYADGLKSNGTQSSHKSQHATSYALAFGIVPEELTESMAEYIANMGMKQGPMTADILVEALFDSGRADAAVNLLTNTEDYGWAKLVNEGYTFTWEQWQYGESQSHGWGAAAALQMVENLAGVEVSEAGASEVVICPADTRQTGISANSSIVTERGKVDVSYEGEGTSYTMTVTVPVNVKAKLVFPVVDGGQFVEVNGNNGTSEYTEDTQIITIGSGTRTFIYEEEPDKTELENLYNTYKDKEQGNYSDTVWNAFQIALSEAKVVLDNEYAIQSEVSAAYNNLEKAVENLETGTILNITKVENPSDMQVPYGTEWDALNLPMEVLITLDNGTNREAEVTWKGEYCAEKPGIYTLTGVIQSDGTFANPSDIMAVLKIEVQEKSGEEDGEKTDEGNGQSDKNEGDKGGQGNKDAGQKAAKTGDDIEIIWKAIITGGTFIFILLSCVLIALRKHKK